MAYNGYMGTLLRFSYFQQDSAKPIRLYTRALPVNNMDVIRKGSD